MPWVCQSSRFYGLFQEYFYNKSPLAQGSISNALFYVKNILPAEKMAHQRGKGSVKNHCSVFDGGRVKSAMMTQAKRSAAAMPKGSR